ncbi:MAG: hypothetical protein NVS3B26_17710 [Mycobacteriales bacterium]
MSAALTGLSRWIIAATVFLTCVLFSPALADPVNVIKLTVLVLAALALAFLVVLQTVKDRVLLLPWGPAAIAGLALLAALVAATVIAPNTTTAVVGTYGRNSGLMAYAAALVLFFVGMRVWNAATAHILALGILAAGLFTASYGLLQYVGVDAIRWANPFNPIIASLGNPDFASAYLGICVPVAAWGVLWQRWSLVWRVASGVVGLMCLTAAALSYAVQGPLAAIAGLALLAVAVILEHAGTRARRGLVVLAVLAGLFVVVLVAGAAKLGPLAFIFRRFSFRARQFYWDGALAMLRKHPLLGVGLDHFGAHWRQFRSDSATRTLGPKDYTDAAHSVPLQMFAQGGLVLGLLYLLFLIIVGTFFVRGLLRSSGQDRLLLGGLGGAWAAYVVSSAVSIDQVPLFTLEFATAGALIALGAPSPIRKIHLSGAVSEVATRRGRRPAPLRTRAFTTPDVVAASVCGLAILVSLWFAITPLRANAAAHTGDVALTTGDGNAALSAFQEAERILPGVGAYWERTGSLYEAVKQPQNALQVDEQGLHHDQFDLALYMNAGRLASSQHHDSEARAFWERAQQMDPTNPNTAVAAAAVETASGDAGKALQYLAHPLALFPNDANLWAATGAARAAAADQVGALRAFRRALYLDPQNQIARAGLTATRS